jgi:hypothetical protein
VRSSWICASDHVSRIATADDVQLMAKCARIYKRTTPSSSDKTVTPVATAAAEVIVVRAPISQALLLGSPRRPAPAPPFPQRIMALLGNVHVESDRVLTYFRSTRLHQTQRHTLLRHTTHSLPRQSPAAVGLGSASRPTPGDAQPVNGRFRQQASRQLTYPGPLSSIAPGRPAPPCPTTL